MEKENGTTNVILVILLVIVVGFVVWYVMDRQAAQKEPTQENASLEINLGGSSRDEEPAQ